MIVFLMIVIIIGLLPIKVSARLSIERSRQADFCITVGPFTIRPRFGQGKAGLPWMKKITDKLKPPIPIRQIIRIALADVYISDFDACVKFGLDEASATAITAGVIKTILSIIASSLKRASDSANREHTKVCVNVTPIWDKLAFEASFGVSVRSKVGRLVHLVAKLAILYIKEAINRKKAKKASIKMVPSIQNNV